MQLTKITEPFVFIIFGASGDLAKLKLFPAIYELAAQKRFQGNFSVLGYARTKKSREEFQQEFRESILSKKEIQADEAVLNTLLKKVDYISGGYDEAKGYQALGKKIQAIASGQKITVINYLAVPPDAFCPIIDRLSNLRKQTDHDLRLIIEKPFGHDEKSAQELFHFVSMHFASEKVYLLDHYLGKEGVQSLLALRYANGILNTLLSGPLIANIQITASEDFGVESRISYFDQVGIVKDMIQSHLLQILSLLTMSLPIEQDAKNISREKLSVLSALKYRGYEKGIVLGQYQSYQQIPGVKKASKTPTFAALRLFIDRQDWYQVPIYIRTGKMLKKKHTYVVVEFKKQPFQASNTDIQPNRLIIELQPKEKIHLKLYTKVGGQGGQFHDLTTSESLACFGDDCLPEHARLLLNVFQQDHRHFLSFEEIVASWRFTDKLLKFCESKMMPLFTYPDFSQGPLEQNNIPAEDSFEWLDLPLPPV